MKIHFTLKTNMPPTLFAQYRDRSESIGLSLVPKVMESKKTLLFEEQVKLAEDYLRSIL